MLILLKLCHFGHQSSFFGPLIKKLVRTVKGMEAFASTSTLGRNQMPELCRFYTGIIGRSDNFPFVTRKPGLFDLFQVGFGCRPVVADLLITQAVNRIQHRSGASERQVVRIGSTIKDIFGSTNLRGPLIWRSSPLKTPGNG